MDELIHVDAAEKHASQHDLSALPFLGQADALFERHLLSDALVEPTTAYQRQRFEAMARSVRDILAERWIKTQRTYDRANPKRIYYMSMEFLIGRSLTNNVMNLILDHYIETTTREANLDWLDLLEQEPDAGLGNGGLGRLAACFLDSMATLQLPAMGYGLRYEYGMFKQSIEDGWQREQPDNWLRRQDPWEVSRRSEFVEVNLGCIFEMHQGNLKLVPNQPSKLIGVPYDRPIVGFGGKTINSLRLWSAVAPDYFDFQEFSSGDFVGALVGSIAAQTLTRVLYPDDSTEMGQSLRFAQEYFLIACSLADLVRRFRRDNDDWSLLPEKIAIQLNDTHPALTVPELMRILLDEAHLGWDQAWDLTRRALAYTNHTLLPEALEKWPLHYFQQMLPRQLEIIYEINHRFLDEVRNLHPGDTQLLARVSLIEEGAEDKVRMAHVAIVGSHSTNGVAAIHSELLRTTTVRDLAEIFPERFSNKTNGVTPRRWLHLANPELSRVITAAIGKDWITDFNQIERLKPLAEDAAFREAFLGAKHQAKGQFASWLQETTGQIVDPDSIFDCHIKRIHEYKRQLLNALRVIILYNRLRANPDMIIPPRTFFFAGKAAPAYKVAKLIIKFINNLALTIDNDPLVRGMKFMMNGALTLGTRDGATIEMAEEAGEENFFLFGLTAQEVADSKGWYNPYWHYEHDEEAREALDLIGHNYFSANELGAFSPLYDALLKSGDRYMHLADLAAYLEADEKLVSLYADRGAWARKAILNVAGSAKFSSDRAIAQYAAEIWNVKACPIV